jgi:5S rRNA maturation endonuclease (ribonuclease M5)
VIGERDMLDRFDKADRQPDGSWRVTCPAHDDRTPSLHLTLTADRWLLSCQANCETADVLAAAGLDWADLFSGNGKREIVATYDYVDERGEPLFQVVRFHPKDFRQRRPDGTWNLNGVRRVIYRLPQVIEAVKSGRRVWVVEGEKDVHALERASQVATCCPGGAGKWRKEYGKTFTDATVIVVADRDDAGRKHAHNVAEMLGHAAAEVVVAEPAAGKDAADHFAAGKGIADFARVNGTPFTKPGVHAEPVDGAELLAELRSYVLRFVVVPSEEAADLIALWILHTHAIDAARATPYLRITSATPESGKTLLLEVLATLCARGWHAVTPSTAVLFRKIDHFKPTLLLDELDGYSFRDRQESLSVLNAGYRRGARVDRVSDRNQLEDFECFCPKAFAGLDARELPPALLSRSVTIRMEAKLTSEPVEMWLGANAEPDADPAPLRERCGTWAEQNVETLARLRPGLPDGLVNRSAEVWFALLALAEHVRGDWPARARRAATVLSAGGDAFDAMAEPVQLLTDIRQAFGDEHVMATETLRTYLNGLEESPWGSKRNGEGLDGRGLARMLRKFKTPEGAPIRPKVVRVGDATPRGYHLDQFADAFARYLPQAQQAQQAQHRSPHAERDVADVADVADTAGTPTAAFRCLCENPGLPADDGRCSLCWGWPT